MTGNGNSWQTAKLGDVIELFDHPADESLRAKLIDRIAAMFRSVGVLSSQLSNLRHTRDLLLPRLLSGQVDLSTSTN